MNPPVAWLLGYPIHPVTIPEGLALVTADDGRTRQVVTLNPEMLMQGEQDPELGRILKSADLVLPDGAGVVWALRRRGIAVQRLPGIEFSEALLAWAAQNQQPVALIGTTPEVLEAAIANLQARFPGLNVVYRHHGFFNNPHEESDVATAAASANPRLVLVAMGVPRQEKWIDRYRSRFAPGTVMIGVGGSLDVWSGRSKRAPAWMRALNLEWLYRITSEPWRIRRTYKPLPMFVVKVILSKETSGPPS